MKKLIGLSRSVNSLEGRRGLLNDDLLVLQENHMQGLQAMLSEYSPCVVSGCAVTGAQGAYNISSGLMVLNSKLVWFPGAFNVGLSSVTALVEDSEVYSVERLFGANNEDRPGVVEYRAKLVSSPSGVEAIMMSPTGPNRIYHLLQAERAYTKLYPRISNDILPVGSIQMWAGTLDNFDDTGLGVNIMSGWALCNGQNGAVDLRGRFVVGYDKDDNDYKKIGNRGGSANVTLDISQLPAHRHVSESGAGIGGLVKRSVSGTSTTAGSIDAVGSGTDPNVVSAPEQDNLVGEDKPHENRPPFYTLAYIQKVTPGQITIPEPTPSPDPSPAPNCNLQVGQLLGMSISVIKKVEAFQAGGQWYPVTVWQDSPKQIYPRGVNYLANADFAPSNNLPSIACFQNNQTDFGGLAIPSNFPTTVPGWTRKLDAGGYPYYEQNQANPDVPPPGGGSGTGDVNGNITFTIQVL